MGNKGLFGSLVEARRAGIIIAVFSRFIMAILCDARAHYNLNSLGLCSNYNANLHNDNKYMDSLEINKIVAGLLVVILIIIGITNFAEILYHVEQPKVAHYVIEGVDDTNMASATEEVVAAPIEEPILTLLASANIDKGEKIFKKCSSCHVAVKGGANKIGPGLWEVVNKDKGIVDGFSYSAALTGYGGKWTYDELNGFLKNPKKYIEGTKMSFAGLKKSNDRANVILYLRSLSDSPAPLK